MPQFFQNINMRVLSVLVRNFKHTVLFRNLRIWFPNDGMLLQPYLVQGKYQRLQCCFTLLRFQLTLPNGDRVPPHLRQFLLFLYIPLLVPPYLSHPEISIRLRYTATTFVSMPEAPIHENARPIFLQHQIRMTWQPRRIQPISESPAPQSLAHNHFRLRILRMDRRHILMPLFC